MTRRYRCGACGSDAEVDTSCGPYPSTCSTCDPEGHAAAARKRTNAREGARRRAQRTHDLAERVEALQADLREARREGGVTDSERRRLALAGDLLGIYARYGSGGRLPDDDEIANVALEVVRLGGVSAQARRAALELAGAAFARAVAIDEAMCAERRANTAAVTVAPDGPEQDRREAA